MGWAHCGEDTKGREIGYGISAVCDREGCREWIDRGLSYVCGGMHGGGDHGCGGYFCVSHLYFIETTDGKLQSVCEECLEAIRAAGLERDD